MNLLTKSHHREASKNTYNLPRGESIRKGMQVVFRQQRNAVLRFLRTGKKDGEEQIPNAFPDWNDFQLGALKISERMTPLIAAIWDQAGAKFAPRVGLDPNEWTVVNPHTERMIRGAALAFSQKTNETTSMELHEALEQTRQELVEGIVEKGETLKQLTNRVNKVFDKAEKKKARQIAQTEASRAVHAAQEQAAIQSGVVTGWRWLLSTDACPLCQTIARRAPAVRLGHAFAVIGNNPTYRDVRFPPAHPHCNCALEEILDTDPQPQFADTLHQPKPEAEDKPDDDTPVKPPETDEPKPKKPRAQRSPKLPLKAPDTYTDGVPRLDPSRAKLTPKTPTEKELLEQAANLVFGKDQSPKRIASAIGVPDDAEIDIDGVASASEPRIKYYAKGPTLDELQGTIERERGKLVHSVGSVFVADGFQGQKIGARIHGRMVDWGTRLGVDELRLTAARGRGLNGYRTWPLFGYDGPLPPSVTRRLPTSLSHARTVQDLMSSEEGRDWWFANGTSIDLTFSLAKNSKNRKLWAQYYADLSDDDKRRVMEGKSDQTSARKYPNELGLSDEEVEQACRSLITANRRIREEEEQAKRQVDLSRKAKSD